MKDDTAKGERSMVVRSRYHYNVQWSKTDSKK